VCQPYLFLFFPNHFKILDDLKKIENPEESEIKTYITKLFKNGFQLTSPSIPTANSKSSLGGSTPVKSESKVFLTYASEPQKMQLYVLNGSLFRPFKMTI
jgi:hypothetical protein